MRSSAKWNLMSIMESARTLYWLSLSIVHTCTYASVSNYISMMWLRIFSATAHNKVPTTCCTTSTNDSGCNRVVTRLHLVVTRQCPVSEMIRWLSWLSTGSTWLLQGPLGCYKVVFPCNMVVISIWDIKCMGFLFQFASYVFSYSTTHLLCWYILLNPSSI